MELETEFNNPHLARIKEHFATRGYSITDDAENAFTAEKTRRDESIYIIISEAPDLDSINVEICSDLGVETKSIGDLCHLVNQLNENSRTFVFTISIGEGCGLIVKRLYLNSVLETIDPDELELKTMSTFIRAQSLTEMVS
ncbi:MAG TPA: hypothetical protein VLX91_13595 [Candidatus Acidoferrales bacterium]|nr:hypothetical protein [Candidatus Acidoferrales bacterium]